MSNIATEGHAQRASRMASFALKAAKAGLERVTMRLTQVKAFSVADIAKWTSASKWRVVLLKYTLMDILRVSLAAASAAVLAAWRRLCGLKSAGAQVADGHDDDLKTKIMQWMGMRSVKVSRGGGAKGEAKKAERDQCGRQWKGKSA